MKSTHKPGVLVKVIVALAVFVVVFRVTFRFTPEGRRMARIHAAGVHAEKVVAPLLAKQIRFESVRANACWKGQGYFFVDGIVDTEADLKDLKQLISETHPPAPVDWAVIVVEEATNKSGLKR